MIAVSSYERIVVVETRSRVEGPPSRPLIVMRSAYSSATRSASLYRGLAA